MAADCHNGKHDPAPGSKRPAESHPSDTANVASDVQPNGCASKLPRTSPDEAQAAKCPNGSSRGDAAVPAEAQQDPAAAEAAEKHAALQAAKRAALEAAKRAALDALESAGSAAMEDSGDTDTAPNGNSFAAVADLSIVEVLKRESESAVGQVLDANARPGVAASASALIYDTPRDPLARNRAPARETTALVPAAVPTLSSSSSLVPPGQDTGGDDSALASTLAKTAAPKALPDMPAGARLAPRAVGAWAWGDGPGGVSFAPSRATRSWQTVATHGIGPRPVRNPVGATGPRHVPKQVGIVVPRTVPNPAGTALRAQFRPAPRVSSPRPGIGYQTGM